MALGVPILACLAPRESALVAEAGAAFGTGAWGPAEPSGPFREVISAPARGWFWVLGGERCREAVVLLSPFEVRGRVGPRSDPMLRLLVSVGGRAPEATEVPVFLRCTAYRTTGETVAECRRDLRAPPLGYEEFGAWEPFELDLASAAGDTVDVVLEARAEPASGGSQPPVVAVSAVRPDGPGTVSGPSGPNCVIVLVDALRADRLHCYGYRRQTSPRIDELAGQGTLFEDVVSAAPYTVPAVASLFTGTHVQTHRVTRVEIGSRLPLPTLAEHFRRDGALTAAVCANILVSPMTGFAAGFDDFFVGKEDRKMRPRAKWVTDHAIDCLHRFSGRRFFLYLHYMDIHEPYDPPRGWNTFGEDHHGRYLGEIRYCDSEIGRFLDALDALGRSRETLVVLLADHGEAFGERGYYGHGYTVHREEVQVPLILRWPDVIPAAVRVGARVASIDVHATIAELMGLPQPRHVEGESLVRLLDTDEAAPDRTVFSDLSVAVHPEVSPEQMCIYEGDHKLILYTENGRYLLYNASVAPEEWSDLAADEGALAAAMERKIRAFLKQRSATSRPTRPMTAAERRLMESQGYLAPLTHPAVTVGVLGEPDEQSGVEAER